MSGEPPVAPAAGGAAPTPADHDQLLQQTCASIVSVVAAAIDNELASRTSQLRRPDGPVVGRQITIDASGDDGLANMCRLSALDPELAPEGEVARIEYEHDDEGEYDIRRTYSIQSVRRRGGQLVLMENFLAESPLSVREADFRPIESESYAQATVLTTLQDWTHFRAWQLQQSRKK